MSTASKASFSRSRQLREKLKRNLGFERRSHYSQLHAQYSASNLSEDFAPHSVPIGERTPNNFKRLIRANHRHCSPEHFEDRFTQLETLGDHVNGTIISKVVDPKCHGQSNRLPRDGFSNQVDSVSNPAAKQTVNNPQGSKGPKRQYRPLQVSKDRDARLEALEDPDNDMVLGNFPDRKPLNQIKSQSPDRVSSLIETRNAYEIERDELWRKKWQRRKQAERSTRAARLRKGDATYDWERALSLVWKEYNPTSGLRLRGRLFRLKHVGKDPGVYVPRVEEPSLWTKIEFDSYVHELARVKPLPTPVAQALNSGPGIKVESRSVRERGAILHELMHRRLSHAFIEPEVCNVAIHFLTRHQMIAKARSILVLMEHLNLHIKPSTFNLFLRAAVHQHDLATFISILDIMKARKVRRDNQTLMLLVQCLRSRKHKTAVIRRMEMAGSRLKNRQMRRDLIAATIKQDIARDIAAGNDPLEFIRRMRRIHKIGWMSPRIGNIILDQVCKRISLPAGLDLLPALLAEGFHPNIITLRATVFLALDYRSPDKIATVLDFFSSQFNLHPDPDIYRRMWHLAWSRRWLNVSTLIFVAASINGAVTTDMRGMLFLSAKINNDLLRIKSLARYGPSFHPPSSTDYNPDIPLRRRLPPKLPGWAARVYLSLMGNFVLNLNPWEQQNNVSISTAMMQLIRALATGRFKIKWSFGYQFRQACRLDQEWKIHEGKGVGEKLRDPYPIALELKGERKSGSGVSVVSYFLYSKMWEAPKGLGPEYWLERKEGERRMGE